MYITASSFSFVRAKTFPRLAQVNSTASAASIFFNIDPTACAQMPVQISIGSTYICHKPNASTTRASLSSPPFLAYGIIANKLIRRARSGSCVVLSSRTISLPPPSPPIRELYVSYPGLDKRLDEWIAESLIVSLVTPPLPNPPCSDASPAIAVAGAGASFPSAEVGEKEEGDLAVGKAKTKTELRHEKERRSLAHELSGFRKRKREVRLPI
jgi:hypothetical protein